MIGNSKKTDRLISTGIIVLAALLFFPLLGGMPLFDWDEINFAESAREMIQSKDYLTVQINYLPFYEKPPLFIWMQVASMKLFGVGDYAARFPNALGGVITLLLLFNIGRKQIDRKFGLVWTALYAGSILPFLYFKSGIIDPWFNLFIFLGVYKAYRYLEAETNKSVHIALSGVFIGLAILTKGPVALLVFGLTAIIYLMSIRFRATLRIRDILLFLVTLLPVGGFWFILQILNGNFHVIADFFTYQARLFSTQGAGHGGFLFYHFVVLLVGVFPASLFALPGLLGTRTGMESQRVLYRTMLILFWVVLILFTVVQTKIVHYSSLCYFPLTFMAAWGITMGRESVIWDRIIRILVVLLGTVIAVVVALLSRIEEFRPYLLAHNLIADPFAVDCLKADAGWHGFEIMAALPLLAGMVLFLVYRRKRLLSVYLLTASVALFMSFSVVLLAPRIERYSQHAAIEFFASVKNEDAYLLTLGYKSYAHWYYGEVKPQTNPTAADENWLLRGSIDKPVYISAKAFKKQKYMSEYPDLQLLYEKNGFSFFKRNPSVNP
jgi:4-amino-4-deoxy-L-arabinose transferase-like glycosyltransferase